MGLRRNKLAGTLQDLVDIVHVYQWFNIWHSPVLAWPDIQQWAADIKHGITFIIIRNQLLRFFFGLFALALFLPFCGLMGTSAHLSLS